MKYALYFMFSLERFYTELESNEKFLYTKCNIKNNLKIYYNIKMSFSYPYSMGSTSEDLFSLYNNVTNRSISKNLHMPELYDGTDEQCQIFFSELLEELLDNNELSDKYTEVDDAKVVAAVINRYATTFWPLKEIPDFCDLNIDEYDFDEDVFDEE